MTPEDQKADHITDSELLDFLQAAMERGVVVLRTCRSGCKVELAHAGIVFADDLPYEPLGFREYFGKGTADGTGLPDVRSALVAMVRGEAHR